MKSYIVCNKCKLIVFMNEQGKFICPVCGRELKPNSTGWGGE